MAIDEKIVAKVASLARIKVADEDLPALVSELNGILTWIEQLSEVDVEGVLPYFEDSAGHYISRPDQVTDGANRDGVMQNAPDAAHGFFSVPKVIE